MDLFQLLLIDTMSSPSLQARKWEAQRSIDTCPKSQTVAAQVVGPPSLLSLLKCLVTEYH